MIIEKPGNSIIYTIFFFTKAKSWNFHTLRLGILRIRKSFWRMLSCLWMFEFSKDLNFYNKYLQNKACLYGLLLNKFCTNTQILFIQLTIIDLWSNIKKKTYLIPYTHSTIHRFTFFVRKTVAYLNRLTFVNMLCYSYLLFNVFCYVIRFFFFLIVCGLLICYGFLFFYRFSNRKKVMIKNCLLSETK